VHSDNDIVCQFAECDTITQYLSKCRLSFNLEAGAYMVLMNMLVYFFADIMQRGPLVS